MQELLRKRIEVLKGQQKQGQTMVEHAQKEVLMINGALNEATNFLNHLITEEKKAAEAKAKEEAKKSKVKTKKKASSKSTSETESTKLQNATDQALAA